MKEIRAYYTESSSHTPSCTACIIMPRLVLFTKIPRAAPSNESMATTAKKTRSCGAESWRPTSK